MPNFRIDHRITAESIGIVIHRLNEPNDYYRRDLTFCLCVPYWLTVNLFECRRPKPHRLSEWVREWWSVFWINKRINKQNNKATRFYCCGTESLLVTIKLNLWFENWFYNLFWASNVHIKACTDALHLLLYIWICSNLLDQLY